MRDRILGAIGDLFYRGGTYLVGVDQIVRHLKITRATLYRHFDGKEALIVAYLQRRHHLVSSEIEERIDGLEGEAAVLTIFDSLVRKTANEAFRGCAFLIAAIENPGSIAIQDVSRTHKAYLHDLFSNLVKGWGDEGIVEQLLVLYEGALAASVLRPEAQPARAAKAAVETLVLSRRSSTRGGAQ